MLKKRIIPVQLLINNRLVKTIKFGNYRDVGNPVTSSKIYSASDADELIFLNINRDYRTVEQLLTLIEKVSEVCFMPLSLGGGIKTLKDAEQLLKNGADKIVVNSASYRDRTIISQIADRFGTQAVIVSIDTKLNESTKEYQLYSNCGRQLEDISLEQHVKESIEKGAGEIFINSIDRDGTMTGYDIDLIKKVFEYSSVPVIACGGAGNFGHMKDVFLQTGVSALACGSLFNFGDNNPIRAKAFLSNYGLPFKVI
ncbi:MAG: imidazole glycerol phosphate synthase cyclase subunit [Planctomycetes bacterium GWF2_39_10]|nr:MAG: imidazole glycerol phosphate synthase cyclase subunit [Planctomycetes bacterium GWA2_39_15]OHB46532.1 MAG: imidazole glycerol phosphate synthase cyclase subunit [Planctomycetes bacterium GWF2_39_10]OHC01108.1 MAG: imidazole glycerol phosphate synthase cyclase subunit [Planctomycetes bacterium RIFCSPLOWO2_12_FULL_39_13]